MFRRVKVVRPSVRARIVLASATALVVGVGAAVSLGTLGGPEGIEEAEGAVPGPAAVVELPEVVSGRDAVEALGGEDGHDLAAVAEEHGWSIDELVDTLRNDETLNVDRSGRLFYADTMGPHAHADHADRGELPEPEVSSYATSGRGGSGDLPQGAIAPLEDTFELHSSRSSQVLFLDFDGHHFGVDDASYGGNAWGLSGKASAWDPAGDGPGFNDAELIRIQRIWAMVSEQFSFLDVDVTTQRPAYNDRSYQLRVVVSPTLRYVNKTVVLAPTDTPGALGGTVGLAYVGTARTPSYDATPALVFADGLREADDATFAGTISHEFGHNYGLRHAFESPSYQPNITQGSSATEFSSLLMDYALGARGAFFSNQERAFIHNGAGGGTSSQYRSSTMFMPADRTTPFLLDDTPSARRGVWSGRNPYDMTGSAPTTRAIDLGTVRCTSSVRVVAEPAAPIQPLFDARIRLLDGETVVATATEETRKGTSDRSAGLGATLEFETDPDVTYRVLLDTDPDGASWAGGGDVAYGRFTAAISGEGCGFEEVAPSEPRGVSAVAQSGTGAVTLSWQEPMQPGSETVRYEVAVDGRRVSRVEPGATSVRLADLPDDGTWVRVRAVNDRGASEWVEIRTPYVVPQEPLHVSAVRNAAGNVIFSVVHARGFVPSAEDETARALLPERAGYFPLPAAATRRTFSGEYFLQPSGYEYRLLGARRNISTPFVVRDAVTAPGVPEDLTASVAGDSAEIRWAKPLDDGGAFAAYRVSVDGGAWVDLDGFTFAHDLDGLGSGAHTVSIKSVHVGGESAVESVTFTVGAEPSAPRPASVPRDVEIVEDASGTRVKWSMPARLHGASVERWRVVIGGREVLVDAGRRQLSLTGFRGDRTLAVTVAAVTSNGSVEAVGVAATVRLAPGV